MSCILTSLPRNKTRPFIKKELGMRQEYMGGGTTKLCIRGPFSYIEKFGLGGHYSDGLWIAVTRTAIKQLSVFPIHPEGLVDSNL